MARGVIRVDETFAGRSIQQSNCCGIRFGGRRGRRIAHVFYSGAQGRALGAIAGAPRAGLAHRLLCRLNSGQTGLLVNGGT